MQGQDRMGRIQDAINKIQRTRDAVVSRRPIRDSASVQDSESAMPQEDAATLSEPSAVADQPNYGGRQIHVDVEKLIGAGLLDPDYLRRHRTKEYRQMKKAVLTNAEAAGPTGSCRSNLIMVASAAAGDGRTFLSLSLSMSLATETGQNVVLIDLDINNPQLTRVLGLEGENGLVDLLLDPSLDADDLISNTNIPGLAFLPAGNSRQDTATLLGGVGATEFFDALSASYPQRICIFDSSPLLGTEEGPALASQLGQALFVVQAGKTQQRLVSQALDMLGRERPINVVLNKVTTQY